MKLDVLTICVTILGASPMDALYLFFGAKTPLFTLQQILHLHFLDYICYSASLQIYNTVAFTIHISNVFFYYNNQVLKK